MEAEHDCERERERFGFCTKCAVERIEDPRADAPPLPLGLVLCAMGCGESVNPSDHRTFRRMIGWARPRGQGGTNALALRQDLQQYAHAECIDKAKSGLLNQPALPIEELG